MTEVLFYHLTESRLEQALPPLLEKSLDRGWRVAVQAADTERRDALDNALWTFSDASFLPHGLESEPNAESQPILLTTGEGSANEANIRFLIDGAPLPDLARYERVVVMFDGHDADQLETAREQWKRLKGEGHTLTYWQQTGGGRWERKA